MNEETTGTALEVADQGSRSVNAFASEANFEAAKRMAMAFTTSSLVPNEYRGENGVANTLIAMELANRIGANVLMVMQNLHIVHNRPGWASSFLIATVNACGRFSPLRYRFEGEPGTDEWGCRAYAIDKETGEECEGTLVTIGMAKAEKWYQKTGSKWQTMPEQMLRYRSAAFWTRTFAPEISLGIHTADEVSDMSNSNGRSVEALDLNAALEDEGIPVAEIVDETTGDITDEPELEL